MTQKRARRDSTISKHGKGAENRMATPLDAKERCSAIDDFGRFVANIYAQDQEDV